ncbi:MAG: MBL fold metallo-hydrolase [Phycisphaerae bacterium]
MHVDCLVLGLYETNCYVVRHNQQTDKVIVIDTGLDTSSLADYLQSNNLNPAALILTHGHADHIAGAALVKNHFKDVKLYIHKQDVPMLGNAQANLSVISGGAIVAPKADLIVEDGDTIEQADLKFEVIHTPGHTPGCICLYAEEDNILFSGDTLFAGGVGRTDFPGGSEENLLNSIKNRLLTLPDNTIVYPGHGPQTTIAQERRYNPFLR